MRISDWSSDVCSSDLPARADIGGEDIGGGGAQRRRDEAHVERQGLARLAAVAADAVGRAEFGGKGARKSVGEGTSGSVRVDLGCGRRNKTTIRIELHL